LKKIVSIVGLTSSGKTGVGIELAKRFNGEIISCDSRQVYKYLDLATGKDKTYPHHLIDILEPGDSFSVFEYQKLAFEKIEDVLGRGKLPILVGGTGLYSRSVVENYFGGEKYHVLQIALMPPKELIRERISIRLDERIKQGMVEETQALLDKNIPDEWFSKLGLEMYWNVELIRGRISLEEYRDQLFIKICQYAKRQRTWFKKEKNTIFLEELEKFLDTCMFLVSKFVS